MPADPASVSAFYQNIPNIVWSGVVASLATLIGSMTEGGITALMAAAYHGQDEALGVLLSQRRIDVDRATPSRFNSGYFAVYSEDSGPLRTGRRTALMYAAAAGRAEGVTLLLQHWRQHTGDRRRGPDGARLCPQ